MLSLKEKQILVYLCQGLTYQEIADKIFTSKAVVEKKLHRVRTRFDCRNSVQLVSHALQNNLIPSLVNQSA